MAHISSSFSHIDAGRLRLTLSGVFFYGVRRDAGFPGGDATNAASVNWAVRAYTGPSGASKTSPIDRFAPVVVVEYDYPGGNQVWLVGTETVGQVAPVGGSGIYAYGIADIDINLTLAKK